MPEIRAGFVHALYLFDVAEAIDLAALKTRLGPRAASAKVDDKTPGPPRLHYAQPPVIVDGASVGCADLEGFRVRVKFFDYGVTSLMLSRPFAGSWSELLGLGQALIESEPLERCAFDACRTFVDQFAGDMRKPRATFLSEDYLTFAISEFDGPLSADALVDQHGADIAQLLRGERQPLSRQERDEILRNRLSYLADDLFVATWNAAFIFDTEAAALGAVEIVEFANSQLLEFRYHDDLLESELTQIYGELQQPRWIDRYAGRRHTTQALRLHALFIDVNELTDKMENALKLVGDVYAARLFGIVSARLGLERWKQNVEEKLETLDDIYRFAVEQTGISQANILELVIVLILVIELGLLLFGVTK